MTATPSVSAPPRVALAMLLAAYLPGRIKRAAKHPMLLAVKLWALAHLLVNGNLADVLLFSRHWGFDLADVKVPVHWWHGDADHIIPFGHGVQAVTRLPDAQLHVLPGESHLAGLGAGEEILVTLLEV